MRARTNGCQESTWMMHPLHIKLSRIVKWQQRNVPADTSPSLTHRCIETDMSRFRRSSSMSELPITAHRSMEAVRGCRMLCLGGCAHRVTVSNSVPKADTRVSPPQMFAQFLPIHVDQLNRDSLPIHAHLISPPLCFRQKLTPI